MAKIKYGIIGFGGIAENRIAKEGFACDKSRFKPLENAELVAVTDVNPARRAAAEALGLKWYGSADELLADSQIQAIFVATNNLTHASVAMKALKANRPVIVEKPMATTVADGEALVNYAKSKGLSLTVDHMMVYNAWNKMARDMVKGGALGTVNDACFHMEFAYGYDPAEAATWRCANPDELGGPIGDVASHCFYMAEYFFDEPIVKLAAIYYPKLMDIVVEDGAYVKFQMKSGRQASCKVAFSELRGGLGGTLSNLGYEIYGDVGALRSYGTMFQLSGHQGEPIQQRLILDRFDGTACPVVPESYPNIYQSVIISHAKSIIDGKPLEGNDAVHNLRLCAATHESAQNGGKLIEIK
ncbi:MAG: Gfo/Idh/MocA family oxidoreductase [Lentisphaerae bacterium]|jgi:1,5-anhydro-D-fructose reductase (1,5-anhydro-D-mannitol-forming)|nr:Gfo/Idh/MocA family oxidoreductase [Lentisphaerota bacterium]